MDCAVILAQAVGATNGTAESAEQAIVPIDLIWQQITSLEKLEAFTFMAFGAVCLFYGWRIFRILVAISFALIGLFVGIYTNNLLIGGNEIWLGIICMILFAAFSIPMMRWGVCLLGAAAGGVITGGAWFALNLPQQYIWAGALVGLVAGGMISFIVFKVAVILFSSIGGGALIVAGTLALIYHYTPTKVQMQNLVLYQQWFLPVAIMVPMLVGIIVQNKFIKGSKEWDI